MPLVADHTTQGQPFAAAYVASVDDAYMEGHRRFVDSDVTRSNVTELSVAGTTYPLRAPCRMRFLPGVGELLVAGFSPEFIGVGLTLEEARNDWQLKVHAAFQDLFTKQRFEMTDEEKRVWDLLSGLIDVTVLRNTTPMRVRAFGRVSKTRPYPCEIQWENGRVEEISLGQAPGEFVAYKAGQPFEAVVERNPVDYGLIRIIDINRRPQAERLPKEDEDRLLDSIRSSRVLREVEWGE